MPTDFRSDPPLAAQQLLWLRKPQMRAEKADQNGNDYRAVNHDPNPRRRVSWPRAGRLPGTGRGLIRRPHFRRKRMRKPLQTPSPTSRHTPPARAKRP